MDVMLLLEAGSLTAVYTDFKAVADAEGRGLTLNEFVTAFLRHVHPDRYKRDALALVKQLIEIFDVIDVNGDASMEWSEFVSFCIEAGMAAVKREPKAAFGLQNDLQYTDAVTGGGGITGPQPGVSHGFAHARFEPDLNAVVVVEAHSRVLRFLTPRLRPICSLDASGAIRANKRSVDMSRVAGFAYVPCERLMAVLLTSHLVGTWAQTDKDGWRFLDVLPRPPGEGLVNTLAYDSFSHCLVLGTSTGAIHTFSPKERKLLRTVNVPSSAAASEGTSTGPGGSHHDVILSLCAVPSQGVLLSSCLDGTVAVWDTGRWKLRRVMTTGGRAPGGHVTKLLPCETNGMVFGLSAKNAIVSAGSEQLFTGPSSLSTCEASSTQSVHDAHPSTSPPSVPSPICRWASTSPWGRPPWPCTSTTAPAWTSPSCPPPRLGSYPWTRTQRSGCGTWETQRWGRRPAP